jgi:lysophospholipase L1-like esterase
MKILSFTSGPRPFARWLLPPAALLALVGIAASLAPAQTPVPQTRRIAIFGSSVASGTGDDAGGEGYAGRLRRLLAPRGWEVLNQSRGGDSTLTAAPRFAPVGQPEPNTKYLLPVNPAYVVIGLSLGNEGIKNQSDTAGRDAIYQQFERGILGFIQRSRENRIVPVVANCYARQDFTATEYDYTKRMNLLINSWDVPSFNFLGAVDDGTGKWAKGFIHDSLHPNASGHAEMAMTIVPSLFDALEQGKARPARASSPAFARASGQNAALTFTPDEKMHPFALGVSARTRADGTVATVTGSTLAAETYYLVQAGARGGAGSPVTLSNAQLTAINSLESRAPDASQAVANARAALALASLTDASTVSAAAANLAAAELALALARADALAQLQAGANRFTAAQLAPIITTAGRGGSLQTFGRGGGAGGGVVEETALNASGGFSAGIGVRNNVWAYTSANGTVLASSVHADGNWHNLVLSHYTARGETLFYVDGQLVGRTDERLEPKSFRLGRVTGAEPVDLRDALLYRSALNDDEVAALHSGTLLQSSLEIYAPLADASFAAGTAVENRAQSLTAFTAGTGLVAVAR